MEMSIKFNIMPNYGIQGCESNHTDQRYAQVDTSSLTVHAVCLQEQILPHDGLSIFFFSCSPTLSCMLSL